MWQPLASSHHTEEILTLDSSQSIVWLVKLLVCCMLPSVRVRRNAHPLETLTRQPESLSRPSGAATYAHNFE